jgi:23S rRNA pseudoU1915 N3-methylase RlmH
MISNPHQFPQQQFAEFHLRISKTANFNIGVISSSATWKNQNKKKINPKKTQNPFPLLTTNSLIHSLHFFFFKKKTHYLDAKKTKKIIASKRNLLFSNKK